MYQSNSTWDGKRILHYLRKFLHMDTVSMTRTLCSLVSVRVYLSMIAFFLLLTLLKGWSLRQSTTQNLASRPASNRAVHGGLLHTRGKQNALKMAIGANDVIIDVKSEFQTDAVLKTDGSGVSLSDYMKLPVEQYVCIQMPLNSTLERLEGTLFNLTVPPVGFFHLEVSPMLKCKVSQDEDSVVIKSNDCTLRGSPYVVGLNGCYNFNVETRFRWEDSKDYKVLKSNSHIHVEVDPPQPFKFFPRKVLSSTGHLAMSIALKQIENAFVKSLAEDYARWANDAEYRKIRSSGGCVVPMQ